MAQRGDVTHLKTHSCISRSQDLNPGLYDLKSHVHNPKALLHLLFLPDWKAPGPMESQKGQNLQAH